MSYRVICADIDCGVEYNRDKRKACPACGCLDYEDVDDYADKQRAINNMELGDYVINRLRKSPAYDPEATPGGWK